MYVICYSLCLIICVLYLSHRCVYSWCLIILFTDGTPIGHDDGSGSRGPYDLAEVEYKGSHPSIFKGK